MRRNGQRCPATCVRGSPKARVHRVRNGEAQPRCRPRFPVPPSLPAQPGGDAGALFRSTACAPRLPNSVDLLASPAGMMIKRLLPQRPDRRADRTAARTQRRRPAEHARRRLGLARRRTGDAAGADRRPRFRHRRPGQTAIDLIREPVRRSGTARRGAGQPADCRSRPVCRASAGHDQGEVSRLSLISTLAIIAVLFFVYRSAR
jgi:hypothetical protein